jgi:hypothetical protein
MKIELDLTENRIKNIRAVIASQNAEDTKLITEYGRAIMRKEIRNASPSEIMMGFSTPFDSQPPQLKNKSRVRQEEPDKPALIHQGAGSNIFIAQAGDAGDFADLLNTLSEVGTDLLSRRKKAGDDE